MNYIVTNNTGQVLTKEIEKITLDEAIKGLKTAKVVSIDTETTGLNWVKDNILMLQISTQENNYIFDCQTVDIKPLAPLFSTDKVLKIFHNVKFDYKFLLANNIQTEHIYDTMLADQVINCGKTSLKYSLDSLLDRYLDIYVTKDTRSSFIGHKGAYSTEQLRYALNDTEFLIKIREKQLQLITEHHLQNVIDLENQAALAFADIEYNGIYLNKDKWEANYVKVREELAVALSQLDKFIEEDDLFEHFRLKEIQTDMFTDVSELRKVNILWSSPTQVKKLFQSIIPELDSVNAKMLYLHRDIHPIVKKYIRYKEQAKLYNAYGPDFYKYLHDDGKIHTSFQQVLNTGRVSSRSPNMQQIPSDNTYRNAFIPENKDEVFVSSDFASQELCIIAYGSQDPVWLKALKEGKDLHSICALLIFGKEWIDAEHDPAERKRLRTAVKSINFGLAYGMSEFKLADTLSITIPEAKEMINKYFTVFPSIKKFLRQLGTFGKDYGYIRTFKPYERIRWFENWEQSKYDFKILGSIERASKNTPIQGTGADMTKLALTKVRSAIRKHNYPVRLVMTVHDQIDTICKEQFAEQWSNILKDIMEEAALHIIDNGLLKSDTNITKEWQK